MINGRRITLTLAIATVLIAVAIPASGGVNVWTTKGPAVPISAVALDPTDTQTLYAASGDTGIYKSLDGGLTWVRLDPGNSAMVGLTSLIVDPVQPANLYAGSGNGQVLSSSDGGASWSNAHVSDRNVSSLAIDAATSEIYAGGAAGHFTPCAYCPPVSRSADAGRTWQQTGLGRPRWVYALLADSVHQTIFAGTDFSYSRGYYGGDYPFGGGIVRTGDKGSTWSLSGTNFGSSVTALARDAHDGAVYAGTLSGGLFRSADEGASWTPLGINDFGTLITAIAADPASPRTLYVATNGLGIFRSTDRGAQWKPFNAGLSSFAVTSLAIDATGKILHVGTDSGVFDREIQPPPDSLQPCHPGDDRLCLFGSRFRVQVTALDPNGSQAVPAHAVPQGQDFGYFSLPSLTGDPTLPEIFVKMIDATSLPGGGFWVFYGSLTSAPYSLSITDTTSGLVREFDGQGFCGGADTDAFPAGTASAAAAESFARPLSASGEQLQLLSQRFHVAVATLDPHTGLPIAGAAIPQADRFGYFSFPALTGDPDLPEVMVKMIDATSLPGGGFWVFYTGLTSLPYALTVTDSFTGRSVTFHNGSGDPSELCGGADTESFGPPPTPPPSNARSRQGTPQTGGNLTATLSGNRLAGQYTEVYDTGVKAITFLFQFVADLE